jgi:hypothetical protein
MSSTTSPTNPKVTLCGCTLEQPDHICAFFDSRDQQYDVLSPFYQEGLEQGEQIVTIVDRGEEADHRARLMAHGIAVDDAVAAGSLKVCAAEDWYTGGGSFAATRMYDVLHGALAEAKRQGRRVRGTGVMDWSSRGYPGTEELMEYEARVNVLVPIYDCTLLCVYDLAQMNGRLVMDVLSTHPYVIDRGEILKNPYYRPPIDLLRDLLLRPKAGEDQPLQLQEEQPQAQLQ